MTADYHPLLALLLTVSGWVSREQQRTIEYLVEENRVLKEQFKGRPSSWKTFLGAHWGEIVATDFFTTEVWTSRGLVTYCTLFLIDLKTRRVHVAGSTPHPGESFMAQVARNLTDASDGFLVGHRRLICDRDTKFTIQFRRILRDSGVDTVLTHYRRAA